MLVGKPMPIILPFYVIKFCVKDVLIKYLIVLLEAVVVALIVLGFEVFFAAFFTVVVGWGVVVVVVVEVVVEINDFTFAFNVPVLINGHNILFVLDKCVLNLIVECN